MTRNRLALAALAIAAFAILAIWKPWSKEDSAASPEPVAEKRSKRTLSASERREMAPAFDVLADDDAIGTLRLEGQVIDETESGVAGALVTVSSNPPRVVTTEDNGTFVFDKLASRSYRLVARTDSAAAAPVTARLSDKSEPVILRIRPSSSIEVTVLSLLDREPIAGATVELRGALSVRVTTGADGLARLPAVPAGRYQVAGWSSEHATESTFMRIGSGSSVYKQELLLAGGAAVSGRVLDSNGAPVADAQVLYASASERRKRANPRFDSVVTHSDGAFEIAALPKGTWRLSARHKAMAPGTSEPITLDGVTPMSGVEIRLEEGAVIRGRVVSTDGAAAANAMVRASSAGRRRGGRPRQVYADDGGRFEFTGLPHGSMQLVALHESATSETSDVDTSDKSAAASVVLKLGLTGRIAGRVTDSAGEPVDGAQVRLMPDFRGGATFSRAEFRLRGFSTELTDAGGRFEFVGLRDDPYLVSATPPGSQQARRGGRRQGGVPAAPGDTNLEIVLEARGSIRGKVAFDSGGAPGAFTVQPGGGRATPIPFASEDGSFRLDDLEARDYRLMIRGSSFNERSLADVTVAPGEATDVGTITVKAGRRVAGRVLDAGGSPVENATVIVGSRLRGGGSAASGAGNRRFGFATTNKETTTDADGAFLVAGIGALELALIAEHPVKGRSKALSLPRTADSSLGLVIALEAPGALEGRVTVNGAPDSVRITARSKTATGATFSVSSGEDGTYRFDVLAPDVYSISASVGGRRRGFGSISKTQSIEAGKTATLNLEFVSGSTTLIVDAKGPVDGLGAGIVSVLDSAVAATTAAELDAFLASREGGFSARGMIIDGRPAQFAKLQPGTYSVCVVALPTEVRGSIFEYIGRQAHALPLACATAVIEGTAETKTVEVPVTIPEFVPPESE